MKFDQLAYFVEVARYEHLGKAAKALKISPSAVSHAIANLEVELGRELFEKLGKRIYLSAHGKILFEKAKKLLAEAENLRTAVQADNLEWKGHYKLAASHVLCNQVLSPAWAKVLAANPKLTSEVYSLRSAQILGGVLSGEFDFGICYSPQSHPAMEQRKIFSGDLQVTLRKRHPLGKAAGGKEWLSRLNEYWAVMPKAFQGIEVCESHPVFKEFGVHPKVRLMFDNYDVAAAHLLQTDDWGFLPDFIVDSHKQLITVPSPKGWHAPYHVSAVWLKDKLLARPLQMLVNELERAFKSGKK